LFTLFQMAAGHIRNAKPNKIQKKRTAAALLVLGLLSVLILLSWTHFHPSSSDNSQSNLSADSSSLPFYWNWNDAGFSAPAALSADRPVYAYSVIPGGVASAKELQAALHQDPVAAKHYSDFQTKSARIVRLAHTRHVYVSYRLADRIYWTRKKVTLQAGETLFTDGKHLARARCGNRISETPAVPTSPSEPGKEVLDHPVAPLIPETTDSPLPGPIWSDGSTPLLPGPGAPGGTDPGLLPFFPFPCCGSSPGRSPSPSPGPLTPPDPPPVVATPEPASLVLLIAGAAVLLLFWKFRQMARA
jgi:hypothetical protein